MYGSVMTYQDDQAAKRAFVRDLVTATVTMQSARDRQSLPGPSDLANTCDVCVARRIARSFGISLPGLGGGSSSSSLKAWVGTAIHEKLERDLPGIYPRGDRANPNFYQEVTVTIGEIPGLGTIRGHTDLYLPRIGTVVDWKSSDNHRIKFYQSSGVPASHAGQTMLYLRGLRNSGKRADTAMLVYIPRDSNRVSDIWTASCDYQDGIATGLLNRAQNLVEVVRSGQTDNLVSDPDCYVCDVQQRIRH
jgi:hypothetical protein